MAIPHYSFRGVAANDLPRLRRWLRTPEVARWWGDPRREFELLRADLDEPRMTMRIVSFRGRPFAYAQDYEVHAWPQAHLAHLPHGARAIDSFIGLASMIGQGHGAADKVAQLFHICSHAAVLKESAGRRRGSEPCGSKAVIDQSDVLSAPLKSALFAGGADFFCSALEGAALRRFG